MLDFISGLGNLVLKGIGMEKDREASSNNARIQQEQFERQIALQKEFAQNSIQWRAADAKAAGLHPLAALGAQTSSFSPVAVGSLPTPSFSRDFGDMGQDLSRAMAALKPKEVRDGGVQSVAVAQEVQANNLKLENMDLQNKILRSKLATINQPGTPPGVPFVVPENKKVEERPPLMFGGRRWDTNPDTSPMKAWEDQYGDEGPVSWMLPPVMAWRDLMYNINPNPEGWRSSFLSPHTTAVQRWMDFRKALSDRFHKFRSQPFPVRPTYPRRERR